MKKESCYKIKQEPLWAVNQLHAAWYMRNWSPQRRREGEEKILDELILRKFLILRKIISPQIQEKNSYWVIQFIGANQGNGRGRS